MIPPEERLEFLRHIRVVAGLDDDALRILLDHAKEIFCPAGTLAVHEGEPGDRMFVIYSGSVEVIKHLGEPHELLLARLRPKDHFGEMSIIECVARSASVRAVEDTVLFGIKTGDLHHLYKERPDQYAILILNLARDLSRRIRVLDEHWAAVAH